MADFVPNTEYVLGGDQFDVVVWTIQEKILGERLDRVDLRELPSDVYTQLDRFIHSSLLLFEETGETPGVSWRNLVVDENDLVWYVDSEPFHSNNYEMFELAHAREQRLRKDFGDNAKELFPLTWAWIQEHKVDNYKKEKRQAQKRRKQRAAQI